MSWNITAILPGDSITLHTLQGFFFSLSPCIALGCMVSLLRSNRKPVVCGRSKLDTMLEFAPLFSYGHTVYVTVGAAEAPKAAAGCQELLTRGGQLSPQHSRHGLPLRTLYKQQCKLCHAVSESAPCSDGSFLDKCGFMSTSWLLVVLFHFKGTVHPKIKNIFLLFPVVLYVYTSSSFWCELPSYGDISVFVNLFIILFRFYDQNIDVRAF